MAQVCIMCYTGGMEHDDEDEDQSYSGERAGTGKRRTTLWLDDEDRAVLKRIRTRYGLSGDGDAFRLAIRLVDASSMARLNGATDEGAHDDQ